MMNLNRETITWIISSTIVIPLIAACSFFSPDTDGGQFKTGNVAVLPTGSHGSSAIATIKSSGEILIEKFNYDGGGLSVYFYLGKKNSTEGFRSGVRLGPQLLGTARNDATLTLSIPTGVSSSEYTALSVWCDAAGVSFTSGSFRAP